MKLIGVTQLNSEHLRERSPLSSPEHSQREHRRWWIVWTLLGSTAINYINRETLSVLAPVKYHFRHSQLSNIFGAFHALAASPASALGLICIALFGFASWSTM